MSLGLNELLIIVVVAVLLIAPKDMPVVMKTIGRFLGRLRLFTRDTSHHFNSFIDSALLRDEVEDEEEK